MKKLRKLILIMAVLFCCSGHTTAQSPWSVSAGFGMPDLASIGLNYQNGNMRYRIGGGTFSMYGANQYSISADVNWHFGNSTKTEFETKPWYLKGGLLYLNDESDTWIDEYYFLNARIGRQFNFNSKFGMFGELGSVIVIDKIETPKGDAKVSGVWNGFDFPVFPAGCIGVFYKF